MLRAVLSPRTKTLKVNSRVYFERIRGGKSLNKVVRVMLVAAILLMGALLPATILRVDATGGFVNWSSPTRAALASVQMLNDSCGWAVGDYGTIIHWDGTTWSNVTSPTTANLEDIFMLGDTEGWAVGGAGTIIRWNGVEWSTWSSPLDSGDSIYSIHMVNANNGWAIGANWTHSGYPIFLTFGEGVILHWNGVNWVKYDTGLDMNGKIPLSLSMIDANNGWAVGENYSPFIIIGGTPDPFPIWRWNGIAWSNMTGPTTTVPNSVCMADANNAWAVGGIGMIIHCSGSNWSNYTSPTKANLLSVCMVNATSGWAAGAGGTILRYENYQWKNFTSPTTQTLFSTYQKSNTNGWAVGYNGTIVRTDFDPPTTNKDYDGQWHNSTFNIALAATDSLTSVFDTYYKINGGPTKSVSVDGQPSIATEGADNVLEYWSNDTFGNEESAHILMGVKLDETRPTGSVIIAEDAASATTTSIGLTLSSTDALSGVAEARFKNNGTEWSDWGPYQTSQSYTLASGDGVQMVYVQFKDNAGCISNTYNDSIVLDTLPPEISLTASVSNATEIKSSSYELSWVAPDKGVGLDHCEVKLDNGDWVNKDGLLANTFTNLGDGEHTFQIKAVDKTGKSSIYTLNVVVNTSWLGGPGYLEETLLVVGICALGVGAIAYKIHKRPKKPPAPSQLLIQAQPTSLIADGQSKAILTIQLLDKKGKPIPAPQDTEVKITASQGELESPVLKIPKGKEAEKTAVISPTQSGPAIISADAAGLRSISVTLNFLERKRFCMHCGTTMPFKATHCPNCGMPPPAGVDTKTCMNCSAVIPTVAKFCSECGAGQKD
jgi:ribosomal protein L40E